MHRRDSGRYLKEAMREAGLSIPAMAARTKRIDPEGRGLSQALIGFCVATGSSAREEFSDRAAQLMADAVGKPLGDLFADDSTTANAPPSHA
jgi:hypothetical protein